ncbi:MAG: hypothetical protein K2J11_08255 [Oscillospiraceae bacterium]|nr:hypothetical protein [Oscillospiraceae bacterium]
MNLKLSYRDKVIFIVVMVIIVLVAGFFLFIKPKFEAVENAKATFESKQEEKNEIDTKIDTLPIIIDNIKATAEEIGEKQQIFLDEAHPYTNEIYIREALSGLNLDMVSMNTAYTIAAPITRYTTKEEHYLAYENKINADLYNELPQEVYNLYNGVPDPTYPETIIGVTTMEFTFKLDTGLNPIDKVYRVMDRLAEDEKTVVLNSVSTEADPTDEDPKATVNLTMYSIFPLNVEEALKENTDIKPIDTTANEPAADETAEPAA